MTQCHSFTTGRSLRFFLLILDCSCTAIPITLVTENSLKWFISCKYYKIMWWVQREKLNSEDELVFFSQTSYWVCHLLDLRAGVTTVNWEKKHQLHIRWICDYKFTGENLEISLQFSPPNLDCIINYPKGVL